MKVIRYLAAAAIALTATTVSAQGGMGGGGQQGGGQGGAARMMDAMMKDISLSDAQKAKVDSIFAASRAEQSKMREEMQASGAQSGPEMMEKMRAISTKRNDAIKAVLTPDQQAVFAKNLENMPQRPPRPPR
jgi:Spy/CpxP family protein refolding chaperone